MTCGIDAIVLQLAALGALTAAAAMMTAITAALVRTLWEIASDPLKE